MFDQTDEDVHGNHAPPALVMGDTSIRFCLCGHTIAAAALEYTGRVDAECPTCGRHHPILTEPFVTRNFVPSESLGWDGATRSKEDKLQPRSNPVRCMYTFSEQYLSASSIRDRLPLPCAAASAQLMAAHNLCCSCNLIAQCAVYESITAPYYLLLLLVLGS